MKREKSQKNRARDVKRKEVYENRSHPISLSVSDAGARTICKVPLGI